MAASADCPPPATRDIPLLRLVGGVRHARSICVDLTSLPPSGTCSPCAASRSRCADRPLGGRRRDRRLRPGARAGAGRRPVRGARGPAGAARRRRGRRRLVRLARLRAGRARRAAPAVARRARSRSPTPSWPSTTTSCGWTPRAAGGSRRSTPRSARRRRDARLRAARLAHAALLAGAPEPAAPAPRRSGFAPRRGRHFAAVADCVERIAAGEIFQANLCLRLEAAYDGDVADLFAHAAAQLQARLRRLPPHPGGGSRASRPSSSCAAAGAPSSPARSRAPRPTRSGRRCATPRRTAPST